MNCGYRGLSGTRRKCVCVCEKQCVRDPLMLQRTEKERERYREKLGESVKDEGSSLWNCANLLHCECVRRSVAEDAVRSERRHREFEEEYQADQHAVEPANHIRRGRVLLITVISAPRCNKAILREAIPARP
jgi:hypothetical protein